MVDYFNTTLDALSEPVRSFNAVGTGVVVVIVSVLGVIIIIMVYHLLTGKT